jgi:hypothetical protein
MFLMNIINHLTVLTMLLLSGSRIEECFQLKASPFLIKLYLIIITTDKMKLVDCPVVDKIPALTDVLYKGHLIHLKIYI